MTVTFLVLGFICLTIFLIIRDRNATPAAAVVKTLVSLFFIATALAAFAQNPSINSKAPLVPAFYIIMGLVLGLVGDIMLDLKIVYKQNQGHSDIYTWAGMAVFGIGHILYIAAVSMLYGFNWPAVWAGIILNLFIFLISRFAMKMDFSKWFIPSLLYGFLLSIFMCIVIAAWTTIPSTGPGLMLLLAGSVLFLLSDLVLSMTYFQARDGKAMIVINHLMYYMAQYAIAVSLKYI